MAEIWEIERGILKPYVLGLGFGFAAIVAVVVFDFRLLLGGGGWWWFVYFLFVWCV